MRLLTFLAFLILFAPGKTTMAQQQADPRTLPTRIADLLLKLPAKDSLQLKSYMLEIRDMGEPGLLGMINMLSPTGEGANSRLEYAIGGFSFYATQEGKEDWSEMAAKAYCQGLAQLQDKNNQAFMMSQLQKVGKEDAVLCLRDFLNDEVLCDPAARALSNIQSPQANEALLGALKETQGKCKIPLVQALGRGGHAGAVAAITPMVEDEDPMVQKSALFALAKIADPASGPVLKKAAEKSGFIYERTEATAAYLDYAENLLKKGNQKRAGQIAKNLMKIADQDDQVQYRSAALSLWTAIHGESSVIELMAALKSDQKEYRVAALNLASEYINPITLPKWIKIFEKGNAEVQVEIIQMLAKTGTKEALPSILTAMQSPDKGVRLVAVSAAGKLGDEKIFGNFLELLKKGDQEEIEGIKNALLSLPGDDLIQKVAEAVPEVRGVSQAALINVLAMKAARHQYEVVSPYLGNADPTVRRAAYNALKHLADHENLLELFALLKSSNQNEETLNVQEAIISALPGIEGESRRTEMVLNQMSEVPADKKIPFYKILASIGGLSSLESLSSSFWEGDGPTKKTALDALSSWSGQEVADVLYQIIVETDDKAYLGQAFTSYVRVIGESSYPEAQKLLLLRKAMALAETIAQKRLLLGEVGRINTFSALVYTGQFFQDPELQKDAANSINRIALANKEFHGNIVMGLLKEAQEVQGALEGYQKEFMQQHLEEMPRGKGFEPLFNGKDLSGWKGLVGSPIERAKMDPKTLSQQQAMADEEMRKGWKVENGVLLFTGKGNNLATQKKYGDFEMLVDWKIFDDGHKEGDGGIYLRGTPQVQIWDTSRVDVGAQVGSGGLYNNKLHPSKPLKVADNPLGEWNNFHIIMKGDTVSVFLNGELVTDKVILENFWDPNQPLFFSEQIELQAHGSRVAYRDIYIRETSGREPFQLSNEERDEGFKALFDGSEMNYWTGNTKDYFIENGNLVVRPKEGSGGNLFTKEEFSDFEFRFEFMLTPGANNGLGIRAPLDVGSSFAGMELQILDNTASIYKDLEPYQYHGSVYGILPAARGALKPVGEWNYQEVVVKGPKIKVVLNGKVILDGDLSDARINGTMDGLEQPGMYREKGHVGFLGHDSEVWFRNIRIKDLSK